LDYSKYEDEGEEYEMVQTYGIASNSSATLDPPTAGNAEETNALLGGDRNAAGVRHDNAKREGHASVVSCISNLLNTIIGSGEFLQRVFVSFSRVLMGFSRNVDISSGE
jgi:hypothetical protein